MKMVSIQKYGIGQPLPKQFFLAYYTQTDKARKNKQPRKDAQAQTSAYVYVWVQEAYLCKI